MSEQTWGLIAGVLGFILFLLVRPARYQEPMSEEKKEIEELEEMWKR